MLVETDVAPEVRLFTTETHPQLVEDYSAWYSVPSTASSVPPRDGRFLILPIEAVSQPSDPFLRHGFYLFRPTQEGEVSHQR